MNPVTLSIGGSILIILAILIEEPSWCGVGLGLWVMVVAIITKKEKTNGND